MRPILTGLEKKAVVLPEKKCHPGSAGSRCAYAHGASTYFTERRRSGRLASMTIILSD
jgi:hypothetical protein